MAADLPPETFATVRNGVSAGEALPARMFHGVREQYGFEILDGIGSTEALHIFISNVAGKVVPGSSGFPVPGYRVELRRADGSVIEGPDEPGMLYVAGESICTGYWCRTAVNRAVFQGEWMRTGDQYVRGDGRQLHLPGPGRRRAQGRRHLGEPDRGGDPAAGAPGAGRGRGRRGARRGRAGQAGGLRGAAAGRDGRRRTS